MLFSLYGFLKHFFLLFRILKGNRTLHHIQIQFKHYSPFPIVISYCKKKKRIHQQNRSSDSFKKRNETETILGARYFDSKFIKVSREEIWPIIYKEMNIQICFPMR